LFTSNTQGKRREKLDPWLRTEQSQCRTNCFLEVVGRPFGEYGVKKTGTGTEERENNKPREGKEGIRRGASGLGRRSIKRWSAGQGKGKGRIEWGKRMWKEEKGIKEENYYWCWWRGEG
jgi:hypothetical protein